MKKTDVHSHILPGLDDGAKTREDTEKLADQLAKQGIERVCVTPHFYSLYRELDEFVSEREQAFATVKDIFASRNIEVVLASEVMLSRTLLGNEDVSELCYEGTRYMLVELSERTKTIADFEKYINKLYANFSVVPVIAHVERYKWLFNNDGLVMLNNWGCKVQFDNAVLSSHFAGKKIKKFIDKGFIHLCGSDAHEPVREKINFDILQKLNEDQRNYLFENAEKMLQNRL